MTTEEKLQKAIDILEIAASCIDRNTYGKTRDKIEMAIDELKEEPDNKALEINACILCEEIPKISWKPKVGFLPKIIFSFFCNCPSKPRAGTICFNIETAIARWNDDNPVKGKEEVKSFS